MRLCWICLILLVGCSQTTTDPFRPDITTAEKNAAKYGLVTVLDLLDLAGVPDCRVINDSIDAKQIDGQFIVIGEFIDKDLIRHQYQMTVKQNGEYWNAVALNINGRQAWVANQ